MGIQDKIFDIEAALEGKPEAELFDDLVRYMGKLEDFREKTTELLIAMERGRNAESIVYKGKWKDWV